MKSAERISNQAWWEDIEDAIATIEASPFCNPEDAWKCTGFPGVFEDACSFLERNRYRWKRRNWR